MVILYIIIAIVITIIQLFAFHILPEKLRFYMCGLIIPAFAYNALISICIHMFSGTEFFAFANAVGTAVAIIWDAIWYFGIKGGRAHYKPNNLYFWKARGFKWPWQNEKDRNKEDSRPRFWCGFTTRKRRKEPDFVPSYTPTIKTRY